MATLGTTEAQKPLQMEEATAAPDVWHIHKVPTAEITTHLPPE